MTIFLKHIEGSKTGVIERFDGSPIKIGRQGDNDVKFDPQKDVAVSGYHAEIHVGAEGVLLEDKSRNGTFVNSQKIGPTVAIQDGDIIQFSPRGPKVLFSTRDPSLASETAVMDAGAVGSTTVEPKPSAAHKAGVWAVLRPILPIAAGLGALVAFVVGGLFLGFSWWSLLIAVSVALLLAGGAYLGWRYWKRRQTLQKQTKLAREERETSLGRGDQRHLQDIRRKWTEVLRSLKDSKLSRTADDPIYAFPWFVIMGQSDSGKSSLLRASRPLTSVTTPGQQGSTQDFDWWFFDKVLVVDTSGRYVAERKGDDITAEWQELLNLLRTHRRREPVNGVLIALPADSLASTPVDKLKERAAQLRERVDDMVSRLGVKFPVYLIITKSDHVVGFKEFFAALPEPVRGQALGYVNSEVAHNTDAARVFDRAFRTICERAERLRLAMMYEDSRDAAMRGIYLFPAEMRSLYAPLKAFVEVLFRPSPYRDTPFFRGVFLSSARQVGVTSSRLCRLLGLPFTQLEANAGSQDLFLRDLFNVVLPNDRALVGSTALGRERLQLGRAAGLIICSAAALLLCGLFTLSFTNNWLALSRLDLKPCATAAATASSMTDNLRTLDSCRTSIESLSLRSIWQKIAYNFGLRQTHRIETALQQRFSAVFQSKILKPLDERLDQSLSSETGNPLVIGSVIQRAQILAQCQEASPCANLKEPTGLNYAILLSVAQPQLAGANTAAEHLRRTHLSYLTWQTDPKLFGEMYVKDVERVERWIDRGGLKIDRVLQSAREVQFPPLRVADFWGVNSPAQVDAGFTARAWKEAIQPLISGLRNMPKKDSNLTASVEKFETTYREEALREWGAFLDAFLRAEQTVFQRRVGVEFAASVAQPESPYNRVIDVIGNNLSTILGDEWRKNDLPPWLITLRSYLALKGQVQRGQKSGAPSTKEKTDGVDSEPAAYLNAYLEALAQLRTEFSTTKRAFESADRAFQEGEPSSKSIHPILKASWAHSALKDKLGVPREEDRQFWILLERPISLAWRAMLEESGKYLQQQWEGLLSEVKELDSGAKGGKAIAFANGSGAAFLSREGARWVARKRLNQSVPFTESFLQYLARVRDHALQANPAKSATGPEPPSLIVRTL